MLSSATEAVERHAALAAFGRPLVQNNLRAVVIEAMVDLALRPNWRWCSADWAGWDFEHPDGTRLEVKQSAARQTWDTPRNPAQRRFDVAKRKGRYEGAAWIEESGRHANLYLFADHPVTDESADHRDPAQWLFYVVGAAVLPDTKTVSLSRVRSLARPVGYGQLASGVERLRLADRAP